MAAPDSTTRQAVEAGDLTRCYFTDQHCPNCKELATVHLLGSDSDFCLNHFRQIVRKRDAAMAQSVVRAIVHLNFSEPQQALEVLLDALTDFNFGKEVVHGHAAA